MISEYHLNLWTWLNSVQMPTPTGNNYITRCPRRLELVSSSSSCSWSQLGTRCQRENQLADWGLVAHCDPRLSSPARARQKCCYGQKNLGSICSCLFPSTTHLLHTTNINPFEDKVWEIHIFIKKCVRSIIEVVIIVDYVSDHICICMCSCMWLYNKTITVRVIVRAMGMIMKGRDKHTNKMPGSPSPYEMQKKMLFAETVYLLRRDLSMGMKK